MWKFSVSNFCVLVWKCQTYSPVSGFTATMHPANSLSPPGVSSWESVPSPTPALEVPKSSKAGHRIVSDRVPHISSAELPTTLCPIQVLAAISSAFDSNPFAGSPGTVQNRQASFPVSASKATSDPRMSSSDPL